MELRNKSKESERLNASLIFSLRILDYLERAGSASLADLSRSVGIHKSRAMRLCGTMEHMGYLIQRPGNGHYALGPRLLSLGKAFERFSPLIQVVRPLIRTLADDLSGIVGFYVIRGDHKLLLCSAGEPRTPRYKTPEGNENKFPYGASSKVLLAWGPESLRERILAQAPYPRYTDYSPVTAEDLLLRLEETHRQGYGISVEERTPGTAALAVPVFHDNGKLTGCISLACLSSDITDDFVKSSISVMQRAAGYLQESLTAEMAHFEPSQVRIDL